MRHLRQYQFILLGWSLRPPTTQQLAHCHIHLPRWRGNLPSLVPAETGKEGGRVSSAQQNFLQRTVNKSKRILGPKQNKKDPMDLGNPTLPPCLPSLQLVCLAGVQRGDTSPRCNSSPRSKASLHPHTHPPPAQCSARTIFTRWRRTCAKSHNHGEGPY